MGVKVRTLSHVALQCAMRGKQLLGGREGPAGTFRKQNKSVRPAL